MPGQRGQRRAWWGCETASSRFGGARAPRAASTPPNRRSPPLTPAQELPRALDDIADRVRNLDAANNRLSTWPAIQGMNRLQRLVLSKNRLSHCPSLAGFTVLKVSPSPHP